VVDLFGDADGNGLVQAYDASRVLAHVVEPFLTGSDSLAANVDSLAPAGAITPFDASLILQRLVGRRHAFPVQANGAANHPGGTAPAAKSASDIRTLSLRVNEDLLTIDIDDRSGIVSGVIDIDGASGRVELPPALSPFMVAWRASDNRVRVAIAGAVAAMGSGELLRIGNVVGGRGEQMPTVRAVFNDGRIVGVIAAISGGLVPTGPTLHPNYPNPFNAVTGIRFDVPRSQQVDLDVFDLLGQRIRSLWSGVATAGTHTVHWDGHSDDGSPVGTGVYIYTLRLAGQFGVDRQVRRMLLLK
jgi:hypothetical protein